MSVNIPTGGYGSGPSPRQFAAQCEARLKQGTNRDELLRQMTEAGCPGAEAERMIAAAAKKLRGTAVKVLGAGILLLALGVLTGMATCGAAYAAGGGIVVLWYGAAISGAVCAVIGIRSLARLRGIRP
jgi:hypothetical protein